MAGRALVIGAGVSGLVATQRLAESNWDVTLLEASQRVGGRLRTIDCAGEPVEVGAGFVAEFYRETLKIVADVGLAQTLEPQSQVASVVVDGEVREIWPADRLVRGRTLSRQAMVRLAAGCLTLLPRWSRLEPGNLLSAAPDDTESVDAWSNRVLGRQATRLFIEPLMRGVFYGECERTSKAILFAILRGAASQRATFRLSRGMASLCAALADGIDLRLGARVTSIASRSSGWSVTYSDSGGGSVKMSADAVICAVPANVVPAIVSDLGGPMAELCGSVSYTSTAVGLFEVKGLLTLPGGPMVLSSPDSALASVNPHLSRLTTERPGFLKVYLSSGGYRRLGGLSDEELLGAMQHQLMEVPGLLPFARHMRPILLQRWPEALPDFGVGYLRKLKAYSARGARGDGLTFAGDYLGGPYVEGAVKSALDAAADVLS